MVVCRKQRVVPGIPVFVIGTMEDGAELVRVFAQHRVEPAAELGREHLAPVMLAHRRDLVGIKNSALKEIDPAEKFDAMEREETLRQIGQAKSASPIPNPTLQSPKTAPPTVKPLSMSASATACA